ncbi:MAG: hypothetical protein IKU37_04875 [Candidatus Gastranaerophilales bacterium]|nr:hypothetical protein [Candidatus Gastranaerophilales bacterium]
MAKIFQEIIDKVRNKEQCVKLEKKINELNVEFFELYLHMNASKNFPYSNLLNLQGTAILDKSAPENHIEMLLPNVNFLEFNKENMVNLDNYLIWGSHSYSKKVEFLKMAMFYNKPVSFLEFGFLTSADTFANKKCDPKYRKATSFVYDTVVPYYDARYQSNLEKMLNDDKLVITDEQKQRARKCIDKIIDSHLTKYNHQPIFTPVIGRQGVKKVLVVDQSYGDMSISKGWATEETFKTMLESAIKENPDADIIVKTHPDTMTGRRGGYYTGLESHDNIYTFVEPINPISLIKSVDKVYVCTTQLGFEALMCNKEVHTFGMPFYANWGLTVDYQNCHRRTKKRTLEEIFYITYILYTYYVNPDTEKPCEIEENMDYLLKLRKEYKGF